MLEKGWIDVVQSYSEACSRRNLAEHISKAGRSQIYKKGAEAGMTKEQQAKWEKLIDMGWKDVAKAYNKACKQDNMTDEWKARYKYGWIEGYGMDANEL